MKRKTHFLDVFIDSFPEYIPDAFPDPLPPYVAFDQIGGVSGIRVDLWAEWSATTGIPVTIRQIAWPDLRQDIKLLRHQDAGRSPARVGRRS